MSHVEGPAPKDLLETIRRCASIIGEMLQNRAALRARMPAWQYDQEIEAASDRLAADMIESEEDDPLVMALIQTTFVGDNPIKLAAALELAEAAAARMAEDDKVVPIHGRRP